MTAAYLVHRFARMSYNVWRRTLRPAVVQHAAFATHRAAASAALRTIEAQSGPLTKILRKRCEEYAREILGDARHADWLHVYSALNGEFREGWIPDSYFGMIVVPRTKGVVGSAIGRKSLSQFFFSEGCIPNLGAHINGVLVDSRGKRLTAAEALKRWSAATDRLVIKEDGSSQGRDVEVLESDMLLKRLEVLNADAVIQRFVHQHPSLAIFHDSVATLRLTTVVDLAGDVQLRAAYLRLGFGSDIVIRPASTVRCAISLASGALQARGFLPDWSWTKAHPTSGHPFEGYVIPSFGDATRVVQELHTRVPFLGCLGWDVSIGSDGRVWVLEVNAEHNDIKFSEAIAGPCFLGLGWEALWNHDAC